MSYGFEVYNTSGVILANSTDFNYGLIYEKDGLSVTTGGALVDFASYGEELIFVKNTGTTFIAYDSLYKRIYLHEATPTGTSGRRLRTTGTVDVRVYTPFKNLQNSYAGPFPYGIQIFDAGGKKTFDTTYPIPLVNALAIGTIPTPSNSDASPTNAVNLPAGISSTPWLEIGCIGYSSWVLGWHYTSTTANAGLGYCARISSNQLQLSIATNFIGPTFTTSTNISGAGTKRAFYICNSAVVTDLSAVIARTSAENSNTCGFTSPATSCTTTQTFQVNTFGGNGQALTYNWTFLTTNGHSYQGSTTTNTATVVRTAGAGTGICTVNCAVSQNGSTTVNATYNATDYHSANPITGTLNSTGGTTSCNYYTPNTSCSTTETLAMSLSGGDGTGITYAWDFTTNTGGFAFSGSITSSTATIVKNGTASTYTGTVRCTVTQSGITYYFTRSISHPHTNNPPLTATITNWANSSSCSHPATQCSSYTDWIVNPSGGNGQAKTYTWSFVSNPGGFVMTNSTSQIVSLSTTAGGTGTLTCTIQCVVSQTGNTPVTVSQGVTHTHTDTGGGGGGY